MINIQLRELRKSKNLKQKDIAAFLNITEACYSHYEQGVRIPPLEILVKLSELYEVSLDTIAGHNFKDCFSLLPSEKDLIKRFRNASKEKQNIIQNILDL